MEKYRKLALIKAELYEFNENSYISEKNNVKKLL